MKCSSDESYCYSGFFLFSIIRKFIALGVFPIFLSAVHIQLSNSFLLRGGCSNSSRLSLLFYIKLHTILEISCYNTSFFTRFPHIIQCFLFIIWVEFLVWYAVLFIVQCIENSEVIAICFWNAVGEFIRWVFASNLYPLRNSLFMEIYSLNVFVKE